MRHQLVEKCLGKAGDGLIAGDDHRQGRRLHPPDRAEHPVVHRVGPREIHADQPIRLRTGTRRIGEMIVGLARTQRAKALADRLVGQAGDPESVERLFTAGVLIDEAKDMLAFASGVRRAHQSLGLGCRDERLDELELGRGLLCGLELPGVGDHRELIRRPPPGPVDTLHLAVLVRLGKMDQMPDRPGHPIAVALQKPLALAACTQHARDIAGNARLFGNHHDRHPDLPSTRRAVPIGSG
jgi:hypothetical protein